MSEMFRYRRLCSSKKLVELNERQLFTELCSAGFSSNEIKTQTKKCRDKIRKNYTNEYFMKRKPLESDQETCYSKISFDNYSSSHNIVSELLKGVGKSKIKFVIVPSLKIKTYLISRRKHLRNLRNFINRKSS